MRPSGQNMRDIFGVSWVFQEQMICPVEGYETLGVAGFAVNMRSIINSNHAILGRVKNHQGPIQITDLASNILIAYIFEELLLNDKGPPAEQHFRLALLLDFLDLICKLVDNMGGIAWRPNRGDGFAFRDFIRDLERRRAAKAMADHHARRMVMRAQISCRVANIVAI
jgi:hypothetical protein